MLVVLIVLSLLYQNGNCDKTLFNPDPVEKSQLFTCVGYIMQQFFAESRNLIYVDFAFNEDHLLDYVHSLGILTILNQNPTQSVCRYNIRFGIYNVMIVARNELEFPERIDLITRVSNWDPRVRIIVVIPNIRETQLEIIFNTLLRLHIRNVVVVNGSETTELFTYNPFENYACGNYYERIIYFGKCSNKGNVDLYPEKVVTGLQNCFFNVSCPHWPPYSKDPLKSDKTQYVMGSEQYIFHLMSQISRFKYNFIYNYDPELYSTVSKDMTVTGPMAMLLTNYTHVMLGGLLLTHSRASNFMYSYGHLDQLDDIRIFVKRASLTPAWKNFYLEFSPLVWALLLLVSMFYAVLVLMLLKAQDKGQVVMVLLKYVVSHGAKLHGRTRTVSVVFISWIWFAYLINCFYQSSLVSLITKPSVEYQIHDEHDIKYYSLQACISQVMQKFIDVESSTYMNNTKDPSCKSILQSIRTVSESKYQYTIAVNSIYMYNRQQFYDEFGRSPVYPFRRPFSKVIYGIYFYKGFPMEHRIHELALRIRETGLSTKSLDDLFYSRAVKYHFRSHKLETRFAIPWYIFIVGVAISCATFVVEVASTRYLHIFTELK